MSFISKIFGKKAPSAAVVVDRIALVDAERDAAQAREAAATARLADLAVLTADEHAAAVEAKTEAQQAVARAKAQIAQLRAAQAEAEAREEREAFDRDVAAHQREVADAQKRIEHEYPELAGKLGSLLRAVHDCERRGAVLEWRGRKLGKPYQPRRPESFRSASPQMWSVYCPTSDGLASMKCDAESAPRGTIRWVNGEPVPAQERVTVKARERHYTTGLLSAITHLPGLHWGEPDFWRAPSDH